MESLERQPYNDEQDDYWLVIEMYQAYVEWLRFQRFGKIEEDDDEKEDPTAEEEAADQVLKLDQRRSTNKISKQKSGRSKIFGATASARSNDSRTTFTQQTNQGFGLTNQPSSMN